MKYGMRIAPGSGRLSPTAQRAVDAAVARGRESVRRIKQARRDEKTED